MLHPFVQCIYQDLQKNYLEFDAFKLISLNDNIVTGSSIMPQKNPDTLEYLRGKVGNSYVIYFNDDNIERLLYLTLKICKMTKNCFRNIR